MLKNIFNTKRSALYIAEIGLNHNGDFNLALEMIDAAAGAGADAVKFQTFEPELMNSIYTRSLLEGDIPLTKSSDTIDFFKKFTFTEDQYVALKSKADSVDIEFFSAPFDTASVDLLEHIGVKMYKIASSEVTNVRLLRRISQTEKPVIMSTGMTDAAEIASALRELKGCPEKILLHCVSLYPAAAEQANLMRIHSLIERFDLHVGFSDHTAGPDASTAAAALGARIFERHFKLDTKHDCPDNVVSVTPEEFALLIDRVESTISMLGKGAISRGGDEQNTARAARRSLFAARFIPKGKIIDDDDIIELRPGTGISSALVDSVTGKSSKRDIEKDEPLTMDLIT